MHEIIVMLRKLRIHEIGLIRIVLSWVRPEAVALIDPMLPPHLLLLACPDNLLAKVLAELKGIEKEYKKTGYPKDFASRAGPHIPDLTDIEKSDTQIFGVEKIADHMKKVGKEKAWLISRLRKHRINVKIKADMQIATILAQCPSYFLWTLLIDLTSKTKAADRGLLRKVPRHFSKPWRLA